MINLNTYNWFNKLVAQCTPHYTRFNPDGANASLAKLEQLMRELQHRDTQIQTEKRDKQHVEQMLLSMTDNIEDPVWAKDVDNNFVFANMACCDKILRRDRDSVLSMNDSDFKGAALAKACTQSDEITKSKMRSCRFIESAVFDDGCFWFDVVKSPWRSKGQLIGTVGTARDITYLVPDDIHCGCKSIEIPIDWKYSDELIRELCG
jgi:transcriptional regulator with PAS, ATPase and Fis domain